MVGTNFAYTNLTSSQLYSTASYQTQNLQGIQLYGNDMTSWDFSAQNLANAGFNGTAMNNANFANANLTNANFQNASLVNANFTNANLTNANVQNPDLTNANLTNAILTKANLNSAHLNFANLSGAVLTGANSAGANLANTNITPSQLYVTSNYLSQNLQNFFLLGTNLPAGNFSGQNMSGAQLSSSTLTNATFANANLTNAYLNSSTLNNAIFTNANMVGANVNSVTMTGADLTGANLTNSQLFSSTLTNAIFTNAILTNANANSVILTGATLRNTNLTNVALYNSTLTNADLTGAVVVGTNFAYTNLTSSQLYSTASYQTQNLKGIQLYGNDMTGWDFSAQNLANAGFNGTAMNNANFANANLTNANVSSSWFINADLTDSNLTNGNFSGSHVDCADLRGATGFSPGSANTAANMIFPNGTIQGLNLNFSYPTLIVRNYTGNIPIHVQQGMTISQGGSLVFQFDGNPWGSTFSFDAGVPVTLGGTLELGVASGVNPANLVGDSFQLFDWTGVSPSGQFAQITNDLPSGYSWNTSQLYNKGNVTLNTPIATISLNDTLNATIITGGTATLGTTLTNMAVAGGTNLNYTVAAIFQSGSATLGTVSPSSGTLSPSSSQACTLPATSTAPGVSMVSITASDPNSLNGSLTTTATLTVLGHSAPSLSVASGNNATVIVGASGITAGLSLSNGTSGQAGLASLDVNSLGSGVIGPTGGELVASGSAQPYTAALDTSTLGTQAQAFSLNAGDDHTLPGAASPSDISAAVTLTVLGHAAPNLTVASGNNQRVMLRATGAAAGLTLSNGSAGQTGLASLDVNSLGGGVSGPTGGELVASGSAESYTVALNTAIPGPQIQNFTLNAGDDHTLPGASPPTDISTGVTLDVVANRLVTATSANFGLVHVGFPVSQAVTLSTSGDDNSFTRVSVGNAGPDTNGISVTGGANTVFNASTATDQRTIGGLFSSVGTVNGSITLPTTGEGLTGEVPINVPVNYTAQVYSGQAEWNASTGYWAATANWKDTVGGGPSGAPGLSGFATDTATFGPNASSGIVVVALNSAAPVLSNLVFSSSDASYWIFKPAQSG